MGSGGSVVDVVDFLSVIRAHWYLVVSMMMLVTSFGVAAAYLLLTADRAHRPVGLFGPFATAGSPGPDRPAPTDVATAFAPSISAGARRSGHAFTAAGAGHRRARSGRRLTAPDCARVVHPTATRHVFRVRGRGPLS
jgi:hypothetical protein